jgi:uncharacterized protein YjdB
MDRHLHRIASALVATALAFVACGDDGKPGDGVAGVTLDPTAMSLAVGDAPVNLTATVAPGDAKNKDVTWSSSAPGVASYEGSGATVAVRGLAAGTADITVTTVDGGKTAACTVTVTQGVPVTGVTLSPKSVTVRPGAEAQLRAEIAPANATNKNVTWQSDNPAAAIVVGTGLTVRVRGVAAGTANVTVTTANGSKTDVCEVTVPPPAQVAGLTLPAALVVKSGGQAKLAADILPFDAADKGVAWASSNHAAATVGGTGAVATITGVAAGTATITATSTGNPSATASCSVTVADGLWRDVYLTGGFGILKNYELDARYIDTQVWAVFVDSSNVEHAAGCVFIGGVWAGRAAYFRNGVPTLLPCAPTNMESMATAMQVGNDGVVHICGYETLEEQIDDSQIVRAKLWRVGADGATIDEIPLGGLDGLVHTEPADICVSGGNVYVAGVQSDYVTVSAALWINGAKTAYDDIPAYFYAVAALDSDLYLCGGFGVIRIDPDYPAAYDVVPGYDSPVGEYGSAVYSLRVSGGDLYAAGLVEDDAVLWKNHVPSLLPWYAGDNYVYAMALDVAITPNGTVYALGNRMYFMGWAEPLLWRDGEPMPPPVVWAEPGHVYAKESPGVAVARIDLDSATLAIPAGSSGTLTATIVPADASERELRWATDSPATASIVGMGETVAINGLAPGQARITVTSPDGPSSYCDVSVINVPVTDVELPEAIAVGVDRTVRLTAILTPPDATNQGADWSSSDNGVATVSGEGLVGAVTGVADGWATITIATHDGNKTASCTVTVGEPADPAIYIATPVGLYKDGILDANIGAQAVGAVLVDAAKHVHAAGSKNGMPAYYLDGVPTMLEATLGGEIPRGGAYGIALANNGDVHIAGWERDNAQWFEAARYWVNGYREELPGIDETGEAFSYARAVVLYGGDIYVVGGVNSLSWEPTPSVWKNGTMHAPSIPSYAMYFADMAFDSAGVPYLLGDEDGLFRTTTDLSSATGIPIEMPPGAWFYGVHAMAIDGDDVYLVGNGGAAVYWKNGQEPTYLPLPEGASTYSNAGAVCMHEGKLYIAGTCGLSAGGFRILLWIDGALVDDDRAVTDVIGGETAPLPTSIVVKR